MRRRLSNIFVENCKINLRNHSFARTPSADSARNLASPNFWRKFYKEKEEKEKATTTATTPTTSFEWFLNAETIGESIIGTFVFLFLFLFLSLSCCMLTTSIFFWNCFFLESHANLRSVLHVGAGTSELGPWIRKRAGSRIERLINCDFDEISMINQRARYPDEEWIVCAIGSEHQPRYEKNKCLLLEMDNFNHFSRN